MIFLARLRQMPAHRRKTRRNNEFHALAATHRTMTTVTSPAPSVVEAIGNTPLIRLQRASALTGCNILGKAEFMNPGQSVKDRAALFIIQDAMAKGQLQPGGVIVEGTAGNTGIGLAVVGNALGFRTRHRHPRHAVPGEEGHAAAARRRARRGAGGRATPIPTTT